MKNPLLLILLLPGCLLITRLPFTRCGDGFIDKDESCDDANDTNGDGCDNNCSVTSCGNGVLTDGEPCDDGNNIDADGCEADCSLPVCQNQIADPGEFCPGEALLSTNLVDGPSLFAAGDFDLDGNIDLAIPNTGDDIFAGVTSNQLSLLFGNGDGTFTRQDTTVLTAPLVVTTEDFNQDGLPDLAIHHFTDTTIQVLLGNGTRNNFADRRTVAANIVSFSMSSGDIDGDNDADLLITEFGAAQLKTFTNDGDGNFQAGPTLATKINPAPIALGDLNNDGQQDIVVGHFINDNTNALRIFFGGANGPSFQSDEPTGNTTGNIDLADVNLDGSLDILASEVDANEFGLFLNNGDGSFQPRQVIASDVNAFDLTVGDLDLDGIPDLVLSDTNLEFLHGNGDGTFTSLFTFSLGAPANFGALLPLDGDGVDDFFFLQGAADRANVLLMTP